MFIGCHMQRHYHSLHSTEWAIWAFLFLLDTFLRRGQLAHNKHTLTMPAQTDMQMCVLVPTGNYNCLQMCLAIYVYIYINRLPRLYIDVCIYIYKYYQLYVIVMS